MKSGKNLLAQVAELEALRPELSMRLQRGVLGPNEKGPTKRFIELVALARRGVWHPIEALLSRAVYAELPLGVGDDLAKAKEAFYGSSVVLDSLRQMERSKRIKPEVIADFQKALYNSETYEELLNVVNRIHFLAEQDYLHGRIKAASKKASPTQLVELSTINLGVHRARTLDRLFALKEKLAALRFD